MTSVTTTRLDLKIVEFYSKFLFSRISSSSQILSPYSTEYEVFIKAEQASYLLNKQKIY